MAELHLVFMGVTGSGKSAVGRPVADRLGCEFAEGDSLHPQANIDKMRAGTPLTDEDRWPWLASLAEWTRSRADAGRSTAVTCSALRRVYRDVLRTGAADTFFVHLVGDQSLILGRIDSREHFMPPSLLQSQVDTLEPLEEDERGVVVDIDQSLDRIVEGLVATLSR